MTASAILKGWIEFDGKNMLPPIDTPVLSLWRFDGKPPNECPYAIAVWNGHYWHDPDDDEGDYRDPAFWMAIPPAPKGESNG